jgi:hypothetical protein
MNYDLKLQIFEALICLLNFSLSFEKRFENIYPFKLKTNNLLKITFLRIESHFSQEKYLSDLLPNDRLSKMYHFPERKFRLAFQVLISILTDKPYRIKRAL